MVLFKINGERNCGTNFLKKILEINNFPNYVQKIEKNIVHHWKHGIPNDDIKLLNDKVVDIFLFRNLEEWLQSIYKNPYHLQPKKKFDKFLLTKQKSIENKLLDYKTMKYLNEDDNDKFQKIMEYKQNNNFIIFVNLSFLQDKNNLLYFLNHLNTVYMGNTQQCNYIIEIPHTKNKNIKTANRSYNININLYKNIIDKYKDDEIENFINNLTFDEK